MNKCNICQRPLNTCPELMDCGGDCLECMAECGDPDSQMAMKRILQDRSDGKYLGSDESERSV